MSLKEDAKRAFFEKQREAVSEEREASLVLKPAAEALFKEVLRKEPESMLLVKRLGGFAVDVRADGLVIRVFPQHQTRSMFETRPPVMKLVKSCPTCKFENEFVFRGLAELGELVAKQLRCYGPKGFLPPIRSCGRKLV